VLPFHLAPAVEVLGNSSKGGGKTNSRDVCRIHVNDKKVCQRQILPAITALVS